VYGSMSVLGQLFCYSVHCSDLAGTWTTTSPISAVGYSPFLQAHNNSASTSPQSLTTTGALREKTDGLLKGCGGRGNGGGPDEGISYPLDCRVARKGITRTHTHTTQSLQTEAFSRRVRLFGKVTCGRMPCVLDRRKAHYKKPAYGGPLAKRASLVPYTECRIQF
jgi:hypothetical protein